MSSKKKGFLSYPTYNFVTKDPVLDAARTVIEDSGMSYTEIHEKGGATVGTQRRWFEGDCVTPQFRTLMATVRAAGGDITLTSPKGQQIKVVVSRKK